MTSQFTHRRIKQERAQRAVRRSLAKWNASLCLRSPTLAPSLSLNAIREVHLQQTLIRHISLVGEQLELRQQGIGNRTEIAVDEGRKCGNRIGVAAAQSTYSVLSALSQKSRSAASDLNAGISFLARCTFRIVGSLLPIQIARGQHANQFTPDREHHE